MANMDRKESAKNNFRWFAVVASTNHALNYVVNSFATSLLGPSLGALAMGLNWLINAFSGLFLATPVVQILGFRSAMIVAFWGYTFQICSLYLATTIPAYAWPIAIVGSTIAGITSAIWWTAQGVAFELASVQACSLVELPMNATENNDKQLCLDDDELNKVRSDLSADWTLIYQGTDIIVFLSVSLFPLLFNVSVISVIGYLIIVGIITALLGHTFSPMGENSKTLTFSISCESILSVPNQFIEDSRACLLAPFVFGFGITTAMFCYYINCNLVSYSTNLGIAYLGLFESFSYLIAVLAAYPYAYISNYYKYGTYFVMQFGSFCFLLTGVMLLIFSNAQLSQWWMVLIIKGFYGFGRGVFEGSCRAVYADLFSGDKLAVAFSGQTLLAGLSGGICFFVYSFLTKSEISSITIVNGLLALYGYNYVSKLNKTPISWNNLCCQSNHYYEDKKFIAVSANDDEYNDDREDISDLNGCNNYGLSSSSKKMGSSRSYSSLDLHFESGKYSMSMGSPYSSFLNLPKISSTRSSINLADL